ncbi:MULTISPECIES: hypothetical protein [Paenibacillus]|uniref:Lipoprotein n=2 Tax=Paenibacillus TaxID=44249 RepID=A0A0M1PZZ3_PAEPO|nr:MULTISPECIES: hypothetical protein [Paenibacillus]KAF6631910.1 hypothetical protein H6F38_12940 [Paenibacillus sp. EKM208P]MCF2717127.1 hypothetical protein [Paenibacillus sp. UKAQ_18]AHC18182.1 hypothetical protein X809_02430 [Paenibacillus polymyxa CR1]ALA40497.1 hypothetical protein ABE82_02670 [Paenibacillus peoriae]AOK91077.1 hypothetical protein AOU00_15370 [Paenibacillus polymyxa]
MEHSWEKMKSKPGSRTRMAAFALMLAVPAALTGCGDDEYYDCDELPVSEQTACRDSGSSGYYYGGSTYYSGGSSYHSSRSSSSSYRKSSSSSSSSHSGFGSSGSRSGFFSGG